MAQSQDRDSFIDVFRIAKESNLFAEKKDSLSINRYRQRPKSSIGKK